MHSSVFRNVELTQKVNKLRLFCFRKIHSMSIYVEFRILCNQRKQNFLITKIFILALLFVKNTNAYTRADDNKGLSTLSFS